MIPSIKALTKEKDMAIVDEYTVIKNLEKANVYKKIFDSLLFGADAPTTASTEAEKEIKEFILKRISDLFREGAL
jgi:hypothetical protein